MYKMLYLLFVVPLFLFSAIIPAAERPSLYLPLLKHKKVALVMNHSSRIGKASLVDYLLKKNIDVQKIFAPEHGFRGKADAGAHLNNSYDVKTKLPIISLYGTHKKPSKSDLKGIDIILFDIQDVGVRFYTYLSTLQYVMEAAAKTHIPIIVLDRPNPNGHYIDGPVLKKKYRSFVGLTPIPVVYGMTIGEYAKMLNGERWLKDGKKAALTVIPLKHYTHQSTYTLPIPPSPNLPNARAVALYPSLAFFEGTVMSAGRGTKKPFQLYGAPNYSVKKFSFIPKSREGAHHPKYKGRRCYGADLSKSPLKVRTLNLSYLLDAYDKYTKKEKFFLNNGFFDALAGNSTLRKAVLDGMTEAQIRQSWQKDLKKFKKIRQKYLLY